MRPSCCVVAALFSSLSCAACSPAFAQTKVAAPEISASPKTTIAALSPPAEQDTTPLPPELTAVATPTLDLAKYVIPKSPPALSCPAGTTESKSVTDSGWEVACARGGERHGPYHSFDRKALREVRATYEGGKLHGQHVEVKLTPALSQYSTEKPAHSLVVDQARKALEAGWPLVEPAAPVCPAGTTLKEQEHSAMCLLPGGVVHGPHVSRWQGTLQFQIMSLGNDESGRATLDDRRTARESTYEKGQLTRVLEHVTGGRVVLEVHKGEDAAFVYFRQGGHQLVRTRKGKQHGVQLWWEQGGQLQQRQMYKDGVEHGESARWQSGTLTELRNVVDGKGVVETHSGTSVRRCQVESNQPVVCEAVTGGKVTGREMYEDGQRRAGVQLSAAGVKVWEDRLSATGQVLEERRWSEDGRMHYQATCDEKSCTTTTWDAAGQATTKTSPRSTSSSGTPDTLVGPMNAIRDLLGGSPGKPAGKVAVP